MEQPKKSKKRGAITTLQVLIITLCVLALIVLVWGFVFDSKGKVEVNMPDSLKHEKQPEKVIYGPTDSLGNPDSTAVKDSVVAVLDQANLKIEVIA